MGQLINFKDFNPKKALKENTEVALTKVGSVGSLSNEFDLEAQYRLTLNILINNHPGKECFSIKEVADKLGVGTEFIRRRIKTGIIKATYLGDKPFINIVELARIITEGV